MKAFRTTIFALGVLIVCGLPGASGAAQNGVMLGANTSNLVWKPPADRAEILSEIAAAQIPSIRITWENPEPVLLQTLEAAKAKGLGILLIVWPEFNGIPRPASDFVKYPVHGLSQIDLDATTAKFKRIAKAVSDLGVRVDGVELANEIDWVGFNGDLPVNPPGKGIYIDDLSAQPPEIAQRIVKGYDLYAATVKVLRQELANYPNIREVPIISGGLAEPPKSGDYAAQGRNWVISQGATVLSFAVTRALLEQSGTLAELDGFGLHVYAGLERNVGSIEQSQSIVATAISFCGSGAINHLPCWITEYGTPVPASDCDAKPSFRSQIIGSFDQTATKLGVERIRALYYYSWYEQDGSALFRCGSLSATGHVFTGH